MTVPLPVLHIEAPDGDVVVASDLHLSEPWAWLKRSRRAVTIDAMHEVAASFLEDLARRWRADPREHLLILNGDLFDFDCVRRLPADDHDFARWRRLLEAAGLGARSVDELRSDVLDHERTDGFDPLEHKSVWRLLAAFDENQPVFTPLARLVAESARLVVLRGNHDTELYWPGVQEAFRLLLLDAHARAAGIDAANLPEPVRERFARVVVAPHAVQVGSSLHVEHGHRHERVSYVWPDIAGDAPGMLQLSLGSWYMRTSYSPAQPVAAAPGPVARAWAWLVEKVIGSLYPAALGVSLLLPAEAVGELGWFISDAERYRTRNSRRRRNWRQRLRDVVLPPTLHIEWLRRLGSQWLADRAEAAVGRRDDLQYVLLGHTHWPYRRRLRGGPVLLNSGSWLPPYTTGPAEQGPGAPFTFIHLTRRTPDGRWRDAILRWDPDARRWRKRLG